MTDFWEWMVEAYAQPGAEAAALALQDDHGQNIVYLFWAAWARTQDPMLLARGAELARRWEESAVEPLRRVRRALKASFPAVDDAAREALHRQVKTAELDAERRLAEALEALAVKGSADLTQALAAAARTWGRPPPQAVLQGLVEILS